MNTLSNLQSYNPKWRELNALYFINSLAFEGEYSIKNSPYVKEFLFPTDTMTDSNNPKKDYLWARYKNSALYTNYPAKYLKQALGLVAQTGYEVNLPKSMENLLFYATENNLNLAQVYNEVLSNVIKFGGCLITTVISDNLNTSEQTPKLKVIPASKVLDAETVFDYELGVERYKRIVYYEVENPYNSSTNSYQMSEVFVTVLGIDENGLYYTAKMKEQFYPQFNLANPMQSAHFCISLSYPKWYSEMKVIPAVFMNKSSLALDWCESPIQNLIETSLSIFQLTADLRFLMHQQSSATLVIAGTDLENSTIRTGVGNVINLTTQGATAGYIAPSTSGLDAMQKTLDEQHALAQDQLLTLTDAGKNSSAEAISLRLADKLSELAGIVQIVGAGIQRELELIAEIMEENIDQVDFIVDTNFADAFIGEDSKIDEK